LGIARMDASVHGADKGLYGFYRIATEALRQSLQQPHVQGPAILGNDRTRIREVDWSAGERLHGDEILPTDDLENCIRKPYLPRADKKFGVHAAQADQEIDAVPVAVLDFEQSGDWIIGIANPESGLETLLGKGLSQGLRPANLQCHNRVRIETGPHDPVHCRRHRTDYRVANSLVGKELGDVHHQQR
jgi:hypothetical protein